MKRGERVPGVLLCAAIVIAGCSSSSKSTATTPATTSTGGSVSTTTAGSVSTTTATTAAAAATISLATNAKVGQQILVDRTGRTVYLYQPDGASLTSKVPAAIKANWPPVTASGPPTVGGGLDQSKVAVEAQADGTQQLSYNGHLLYTFAGDASPSDANGQALGGIWFVLSATGDKIG